MKRHKRIPTFPAELIRTQTSVSHSKINYKCPQSSLLFSLTTVSGTGRFSGRKNVAKRLFFGCIFKIYLFSLFFVYSVYQTVAITCMQSDREREYKTWNVYCSQYKPTTFPTIMMRKPQSN